VDLDGRCAQVFATNVGVTPGNHLPQPAAPEDHPAFRALAANALTAFRVWGGADDAPVAAALRATLPATCGCPDCLNAAGLLAYLCDLLDYAVEHLRENGMSWISPG